MRDAFLKLYAAYARVLWFFAIVSGVSAFIIMWIIDLNALGRKIINTPLPAGVEMTQALLPVVIMLPFAYALLRRNHVNTVLLTSRMSPRVSRALTTFWMFAAFILFAMVTYGTFKYALRSYNLGEQAWGANFRFPIWPAKMAVSLGTLLMTIQCLMDAIHGLLFPDESTVKETIEAHEGEVADA